MVGRRVKEGSDQQGGERKDKGRGGETRPGLPRPASIVSEKTFASPRGRRYRIITTSEHDSYDEPSAPAGKTKGGK
jgi:hypothetical protein